MNPTKPDPLVHGGNLAAAAERFGIPLDQWLDLSTGINPFTYPIMPLPKSCFAQLPYQSKAFSAAVTGYYSDSNFVALAGSQAAIQLLPGVLQDAFPLPVLIPEIGYQEHGLQWGLTTVPVARYPSDQMATMTTAIDAQLTYNPRRHLVVINPNNPSAVMIPATQLVAWAERLTGGGCLIVDEAFIDTMPDSSLLALGSRPKNIIVLRSFGKFFGLPGLRLGFVFAAPDILQRFSVKLGPWPITGPTQHIATLALQDWHWQSQVRQQLAEANRLIRSLLDGQLSGLVEQRYHSDLFSSYKLNKEVAHGIYQAFAQQGILIRLIEVDDQFAMLRFGVAVLSKQQRTRIEQLSLTDC